MLAQLSRFGLCMGPSGLKTVSDILAGHQREILQHTGKSVPLELCLVYNNVIADRAGLSDVVREAREKRERENEGPASGFMALSLAESWGSVSWSYRFTLVFGT